MLIQSLCKVSRTRMMTVRKPARIEQLHPMLAAFLLVDSVRTALPDFVL